MRASDCGAAALWSLGCYTAAMLRTGAVVFLLTVAAVLPACHSRRTEIIVFYASSLTRALGDAVERFERKEPSIRVRLEPSGSQVAVRKVTEHAMPADIVVTADARLIDKMMVPAHAGFGITFATNEIVIAHKDHSRFTDEISTDNWREVLRRPGVQLGRADPDTAPIGYHTLMVWQLAEAPDHPGLASALKGQCAPEHVVHDEAEILALLESRSIDYAFLYRSTAEDHHLKTTLLPPEVNLGSADRAAVYAHAGVDIRMNQGGGNSRVQGAPITYGVTIPKVAPHPDEARRLLAFLLGDEGRTILERRAIRPVVPATCSRCEGIPADLRGMVSSSP